MELLSARELLGIQETVDDPIAREEEIQKCRDSFIHFLTHWRFIDRENGDVKTLSNLWEGQAQLAELMEHERQIFALKAGKLGFTELECAYDA